MGARLVISAGMVPVNVFVDKSLQYHRVSRSIAVVYRAMDLQLCQFDQVTDRLGHRAAQQVLTQHSGGAISGVTNASILLSYYRDYSQGRRLREVADLVRYLAGQRVGHE